LEVVPRRVARPEAHRPPDQLGRQRQVRRLVAPEQTDLRRPVGKARVAGPAGLLQEFPAVTAVRPLVAGPQRHDRGFKANEGKVRLAPQDLLEASDISTPTASDGTEE
jgi:hypothetical protein